MKKIAIVSAMEIEISFVHEYLKLRENWEKIKEETYVNNKKQLLIRTQVMGVGKVNAAYTTTEIIHEFEPDLIVNVGYAGAMAEGAKQGDLAIGKDYVQVDFTPYFAENKTVIKESPQDLIEQLECIAKRLEFPYFTGRIATGDFFLQSTERKKAIKKEYDPIAFDMESAAVAQVATRKSIDFIALRTFSDFADDDAEKIALAGITAKSQIEHKPIILLIETMEQ
jgi:adenosylhomocysteine nucleosidase